MDTTAQHTDGRRASDEWDGPNLLPRLCALALIHALAALLGVLTARLGPRISEWLIAGGFRDVLLGVGTAADKRRIETPQSPMGAVANICPFRSRPDVHSADCIPCDNPCPGPVRSRSRHRMRIGTPCMGSVPERDGIYTCVVVPDYTGRAEPDSTSLVLANSCRTAARAARASRNRLVDRVRCALVTRSRLSSF